MKKLILFLILLPILCIAGVNPVLQNPYTTNTQSAADAHVQSMLGTATNLSGGALIQVTNIALIQAQGVVATNQLANATAGMVTNGGGFTFSKLTDLAGNSINNIAYAAYAMPDIVAIGLTNRFYYGTNTAFVSTNGNDSTAVLGNVNFPFLTISNAHASLPTNGYNSCIWLASGQTFAVTSVIATLKTFSIVMMGASINNGTNGGTTPAFQVKTNLSIWGGNLSQPVNPNADTAIVAFHYVSWFPDWLSNNGIDCINSSLTTVGQSIHADHCVFRNGGDIVNCGGGSTSNSTIWTFSDCSFIGDGHTYGVTRIYLKGGNASFKNCNFAIYGQGGTATPTGGAYVTNACIIASGTTVVLDNCNLIAGSGSGPTNLSFVDLAAANGGQFLLQNMSYKPLFYNMDGTGSIINLANSVVQNGAFIGNGSGLTNLESTNLVGSIPSMLLPSSFYQYIRPTEASPGSGGSSIVFIPGTFELAQLIPSLSQAWYISLDSAQAVNVVNNNSSKTNFVFTAQVQGTNSPIFQSGLHSYFKYSTNNPTGNGDNIEQVETYSYSTTTYPSNINIIKWTNNVPYPLLTNWYGASISIYGFGNTNEWIRSITCTN